MNWDFVGLGALGVRVDYDIFVRSKMPAEGTTYHPEQVDLLDGDGLVGFSDFLQFAWAFGQ